MAAGLAPEHNPTQILHGFQGPNAGGRTDIISEVVKHAQEAMEELRCAPTSERACQTALFHVLEAAGYTVEVERQIAMRIRDGEGGRGRIDLLVKGKRGAQVLVELKCLTSFAVRADGARAQLQQYMVPLQCKLGLCINFPKNGAAGTHVVWGIFELGRDGVVRVRDA